MIKKAEHSIAKQDILRNLGERVAWLGFNPKPSEQSFYHDSTGGRWAFHVSFIAHQSDLDLTGDLAIRINAIEDLVNEYETKLRPAEKRQSMTLGGEMGNISQGHPIRWTVSDLNDVPLVCDQVVQTFERIGLQFLRTYSEIEAVRRVLVSSDPKDILLAPFAGPRFMRAIAATCILDGASDIAALATKFEANLVDKQDPYLLDFRALCRGLLATTGWAPSGE